MAPPLISEYKQTFVLKRLFETFLGGPRLCSPIPFVAIQILLFSIPAFVVSLVNLDNVLELKWKSVITGCCMALIDISLALIILLLKKGRSNVVQSLPSVRVSDTDGGSKSENGESTERRSSTPSRHRHHEHVTSFLSQEDMVPNEGCHKPSTWIYIAPNPSISVSYLIVVMISFFSFLLCTPLMISEGISPIVRGFVIFAMCNAHYSAIINSPPEIAIFDTGSPEKRQILYRISYTFLVGLSYVIFAQICRDPQNHSILAWHGGIIAFFPLLWGIGILPDPGALFPWALGTLLLLLGGTSPSFHYAGTLISLVIVGICPIIVFIITQESLKIVLAECICGYIISCDTGRIISMNAALCEDIPTKSFLHQLLFPALNLFTSLLCVFLTWVFLGKEEVTEAGGQVGQVLGAEIGLITTTLIITFTSWAFRYWAMSQTDELRKIILIPVHLLHGALTFLLHTWLTLTIQHEKLEWTSVKESETQTQSLLRLLPYLLTIRGFALAVSEPRKSCLDFSSAFLIRRCMDESKSKSSFVLILFICSLVSGRIKRFFRAWKTFCSIWYAFGISTIMGSQKTRLLTLSVALLPISIWSLIVAVVVEGIQLIPIFTLPIFFLGFPRPTTFWSEAWFPRRTEGRGGGGGGSNGGSGTKHVVEVETVDWKIYSEIGPLLAVGLSRRAHLTKFSLERGDCFLARYEDRLLFLRVVASGWSYAYLQIKGLEMQEQTSCHHHEAAKVDEIFDAVLNEDRSTCSKLTLDFLSLLILSPMCSLNLPTYSESKSNIYALAIPEEKSTFRDMFIRAFSYMWIKNNPALKGEAYQNGLNRKTIAAISTNSFGSASDAVPNTDGSEMQPTSVASGSLKPVKNDPFSVKHALVNFTKPTVDFFKRRDSVDNHGRRNSTATTTIVSAVSGADATENNAKEPDVNSLLEDEEIPEPVRRRSVISRQSTVTSLMGQGDIVGNSRRFSMTTPIPARLVDVESETGGGGGPGQLSYLSNSNNSGRGRVPSGANKDGNARLSTIWVKQCVGDVIPPNAVKARVEKICNSVWDSVVGLDEENEIELSEFFHDDFLLKLKRLSSSPRVDMEQISLKAFRYACKLTLDEIFSSTNFASKVITIDADQEEEIFTQLNQFERDYQFCSPQEIPFWMQQNANHIVTMNKSEEKSIMRILNYEPEGVEFKIGQLDQFTAEGIWANLNLELLYLTSDDDERFSIQNDRVLLRNMMTQCAKAPLGYPVYDALFKVNLHSFSVTQIN